MRIAFSGSHFTGKSTLIEAMLARFPNYASIDEPYWLLEEEGYEFSDPPTIEDFEEQIKCSIEAIKGSEDNTLFDRCPIDCLAYALATTEAQLLNDTISIGAWARKMKSAIARFDLIVYLPIESRVPLPVSEDSALRTQVDTLLQEMLIDDSLGILEDVDVIEVSGSLEQRVKLVTKKLESFTG